MISFSILFSVVDNCNSVYISTYLYFLTIVTKTDLYICSDKIFTPVVVVFLLEVISNCQFCIKFEKSVNGEKVSSFSLDTMSMTTNNLSKCLYGLSKRKCKLDQW